jgi:hypothetical protein
LTISFLIREISNYSGIGTIGSRFVKLAMIPRLFVRMEGLVMEDKGRKMVCECIECGNLQLGWSSRDGDYCKRCNGTPRPIGWWDDFNKESISTKQVEQGKFVIEYDNAPALVFVQKDFAGVVEVYQDGVRLGGVYSIEIKAEVKKATTHKIEYLTGLTRYKERETHMKGDRSFQNQMK